MEPFKPLNKAFKPSNVVYAVNGDIIEVKLRDGDSFDAYFKKKARIKNKKEMRELITELRQKGVEFRPWWL